MFRLITFLLLSSLTFHYSFTEENPNIIVLFIDDMGYADPSCFGNPKLKTDNIDRLADEGLALTNFYVNSPICSASRVALSTGQYQQRWRINSFLHKRSSNTRRKMADYLETKSIHTAQVFKDSGYATAHFGKWHMGGGRDVDDAPLPEEYGFDESYVSFEGLGDRYIFMAEPDGPMSIPLKQGKIDIGEKHESTRIYVDKGIDFIKRNKGTPFYLEIYPNDVHDAHLPKNEWKDKCSLLTDDPAELDFLAVLAEMDFHIGRLLDTLEKEKLVDSTIVIFTSDNGPTDWKYYYDEGVNPPGFTGPLFGRKWSLYEGGIRMPFLIRWPGKVPAGKVDNQSIVAAIDMQLSLASLAGIPTPENKIYDGENMANVFRGMPVNRSNPIYWEYGVYGSIKPGKKEHQSPPLAMRDGDWKLLINPDGSNAKLFNLCQDIGETTNLAKSEPERFAEMKAKLLLWWSDMKIYFEK